RPPALLTTLAQAFIASTDFWNKPGWTGVSTSAMTAKRISEALMPTSSALGVLWAPADTVLTVASPNEMVETASAAATKRESRTVPPDFLNDRYNLSEI